MLWGGQHRVTMPTATSRHPTQRVRVRHRESKWGDMVTSLSKWSFSEQKAGGGGAGNLPVFLYKVPASCLT